MAGDAGLSPEEIEFLRREDGRRKTWTRDYMLIFFWVPPSLPNSVNPQKPLFVRSILFSVSFRGLISDSGVSLYFGIYVA
jgi:hypothetical protein